LDTARVKIFQSNTLYQVTDYIQMPVMLMFYCLHKTSSLIDYQ